MENKSKQIRAYILDNLANSPHGIIKLAATAYATTPENVQRHIKNLIREGLVIKSGNTRSAQYFLREAYNREKSYRISDRLAEDLIYNEFKDIFLRFPKNIQEICVFGSTEMLNNAIDHSRGTRITLKTSYVAPELIISIYDDGIGAFKTICDYLQISDLREGIIHLSKGKITRDPANHTGQGIFFTSRMFDIFIIASNGYIYERDNSIQDWSFKNNFVAKGTEIILKININSQTTCRKVFQEYEGQDFAFDKTEFLVHLADFKENSFISRSQAKRVLLGLEQFSVITFDFKRIQFVGQGFIDEVFRVFANANSNIKLQHINAEESVKFMIDRCLGPTTQ